MLLFCGCQTRALRHDDEAHKKEALVYYGLESALSLLVSWLAYCCCFGTIHAAALQGSATVPCQSCAASSIASLVVGDFVAVLLLCLAAHHCPASCSPRFVQVSVFINMFVTCVFAAGFYGKALQVRAYALRLIWNKVC